MGMREKLEDRIKRKEQEIQESEAKIREARAYIQAMQDAVKLLPKGEARNGGAETVLRQGGGAHKAYMALKEAGKPLHISEILKAIGMLNNKANRISLGGTLARYARSQQIFGRPAPNTFELIVKESQPETGPPDDFGISDEDEFRAKHRF